MVQKEEIEKAKEYFGKILEEQLARAERIKISSQPIDFSKIRPIIIGVAGGDGIGPIIVGEAERVLKALLKEEIDRGDVIFRDIEGLTIENRVKVMKAVPDDVLKEIKKTHVLLKGPTHTPSPGDPWPNIESANVALRKELDLFANVRPVKNPILNIDWTFFRENTEGEYILGSSGIDIGDVSIDFKVITEAGSERIIRMAFDYARKTGLNRVSVVTKANVVKRTDGRFYKVAERIAREYPEVKWDHWFIDIFSAKLLDHERRSDFKVIVSPNLYGDILTDEAAQLQGGVGTAGSANIGSRYAMFEAIHGTAPRMVKEGRAIYADPESILRASVLMLQHIGFKEKAEVLDKALDMCSIYERKIVVTGRPGGATTREYADYVLSWVERPDLKEEWERKREEFLAKAKGGSI
ncbi:MAG: isocitrate/isopropylmalate dehydrogenase family protein [Thermoprotei archaeon]|nr:isocitrate/isopropylmalate dehydrogenase family protein [Thermoprotei archaeon]